MAVGGHKLYIVIARVIGDSDMYLNRAVLWTNRHTLVTVTSRTLGWCIVVGRSRVLLVKFCVIYCTFGLVYKGVSK